MAIINTLAWSILALVAASFYLFDRGPVWAVYTGISTFALAALLLVLAVYLAELAVGGTGVARSGRNAGSSG